MCFPQCISLETEGLHRAIGEAMPCILVGHELVPSKSCCAPSPREWVVQETGVPPKRRKPKGHKHDKLRLLRLADIESKLQDMPAKVAEYRVRPAEETGAVGQPRRSERCAMCQGRPCCGQLGSA